MNRRQKKKQRTSYLVGTAKIRKKNRELCHKYPFLIPRNDFTDKITWDKPYSYTLADEFPTGWWKAFGEMMCEEIMQDLRECHYTKEFRFLQIKEKYGELRAYMGGIPIGSKVPDIIDKYSHLSRNICINCGKPDVPMINQGWISPECYNCYFKRVRKWPKYGLFSYDEIRLSYLRESSEDFRMADSYKVTRFYKDGREEEIEKDIKETADRIREKYRGQM